MDSGGGTSTLYVGNLAPVVNENLIMNLFSQFGDIKSCKMINEPGTENQYCFVEYCHHASASAALAAMNRRNCFDRELKVNWATSNAKMAPGGKVDTSQHFHIFVGDLSPEIDEDALKTAFGPFGAISTCRVLVDPATGNSKGYGFVSFIRQEDAASAIGTMNNTWLGKKTIKTNWATRKPQPFASSETTLRPPKTLEYDEVFKMASDANFTVYCGGIIDSDENAIREKFKQFGNILEIRYFRDKGYSFIRFDNKESACAAIVNINGDEISGKVVKCSWGKENPTMSSSAASPGNAQMRHSMGPPQHHDPQHQQHPPPPHQQQQQQQHMFYPPQQPPFYPPYMYGPQYMNHHHQQQQQQQHMPPNFYGNGAGRGAGGNNIY